MRKYEARFSSLSNPNNWADFAPTILNLIYVETRLTTEWLPSSHVLRVCHPCFPLSHTRTVCFLDCRLMAWRSVRLSMRADTSLSMPLRRPLPSSSMARWTRVDFWKPHSECENGGEAGISPCCSLWRRYRSTRCPGNVEAAMQDERFCNRQTKMHNVAILCGYSLILTPYSHPSNERVCGRHYA